MNRFWRTIAVSATLAAHTSGFAQTAEQAVTLIIEVQDQVFYRGDVTDATRLARDPGVTSPSPSRAFQFGYNLSDIVAVNGKPAKGLNSTFIQYLIPRVNPVPGQVIANFDGGSPLFGDWQILGPDGTWLGSMWARGAPPAPSYAIMAGQGAFFGVSGEGRVLEEIRPQRVASVTEDPANRRLNGGGSYRFIFYLYPKYRPAVDVRADGPAVFHADFSRVTLVNPARAGEVLIVAARNLGPTRPDLLPPSNRPFKAEPLEVVNSPVEVTVNGREAEVINKVGWPGTYDLYRVDFRVPSELPPGLATIQLTAAWIPGPEVTIPVQ